MKDWKWLQKVILLCFEELDSVRGQFHHLFVSWPTDKGWAVSWNLTADWYIPCMREGARLPQNLKKRKIKTGGGMTFPSSEMAQSCPADGTLKKPGNDHVQQLGVRCVAEPYSISDATASFY